MSKTLKEVTLWQQPCLIISFFSLQRRLPLRPNGEFSFSVSLRITYQWDFCCSRTSWPGTWSKEKFLCISPWHLPAWTWRKSSPPHLRYGEKFFIYTKHYTKIVCWIFLSVFFKIFFYFYFNRPFLRPIGNKLVTSPSQFVQLCLVCASITALCSCAISWEREHPADDILFQHVIYWRRLRWWLVGPKRKRD